MKQMVEHLLSQGFRDLTILPHTRAPFRLRKGYTGQVGRRVLHHAQLITRCKKTLRDAPDGTERNTRHSVPGLTRTNSASPLVSGYDENRNV